MRSVPELPACDVGARRFVPRQQPCLWLLRSEVLHDRARFAEHEVPIDERGHGSVGIEREILGSFVLAFGEVEQLFLELDAEHCSSEPHTADVGRKRVVIQFHEGHPSRAVRLAPLRVKADRGNRLSERAYPRTSCPQAAPTSRPRERRTVSTVRRSPNNARANSSTTASAGARNSATRCSLNGIRLIWCGKD